MRLTLPSIFALLLLGLSACGDDDTSSEVDGGGIGGDASMAAGDGGERNGCNVLSAPLAMPGDPIDGDTWSTFAEGFFSSYCTRCHATTLMDAARNGAPIDRNWDDEASVREHLPLIRQWVGELNAMPIGDPKPSCEERARIVRWIDANAP